MDALSPLFARFSLSARVFYAGSLCGTGDFDGQPGLGHLHVLREGTVSISQGRSKPRLVSEPAIIFYPRPCRHRFQVDDPRGAKLVCAAIDFGAGTGNPLLRGLPEMMVIPMSKIAGIEQMLLLLFGEAFSDLPGREAAIDRIAEYFVVLLLRYAMRSGEVNVGLLAALADPRLAKAVTAMHERPEQPWSLEDLAGASGMSRARFAAHFRATTGSTPLDYLTDWRVSVAQTLLKHGNPLKLVAPMVGYSSPVALTRVFLRRVGKSPSEWLARGADHPRKAGGTSLPNLGRS